MKTKNPVLLLLVIIIGLACLWSCSEYDARKNITKCEFGIEDIKVLSFKPNLNLKIFVTIYNPTEQKIKVDRIELEAFTPDFSENRIANCIIEKPCNIPPSETKSTEVTLNIPVAKLITSAASVLITGTKEISILIKGKGFYETPIGGVITIPFSFIKKIKI